MGITEEIFEVLRHDLHKVHIIGAAPNKLAMSNELGSQADGIAAWMGRNFLKEPFENSSYRKSLIFRLENMQPSRILVNQHRREVDSLFKTEDPFKLHEAILTSKLLNGYSEARQYPYSSLKYHLLLASALFYNLKQGTQMKELYLCENLTYESPFQVIYRDSEREWTLLPHQSLDGLSKLYPRFSLTWVRRRKLSIGGDHQILNGLLTTIGSWTVALALLEDFRELVSIC
jgi:hypothetical protein